MKNWTRTSLILLAFSIGACEGQGPTAPTSSLTQSGALATDAQGQVTSLTAVGAGDIQQARGGKGGGKDKVAYSVVLNAGDFCPSVPSTWESLSPANTSPTHLSAQWTVYTDPGRLQVCPENPDPQGGDPACLTIRGGVNFSTQGGDGRTITSLQLWIREDPDGSSKNEFFGETYTTGSLLPSGNQGGNLDGSETVTVHVHDAFAELRPTKKGGKIVYGTSCVGDAVLTPIS